MKDGTRVPEGKGKFFLGCGMDDFLRLNGLDVRKPAFTREEVSKAIDVSFRYWRTLGVDHAVDALRQFKKEIFENPLYRQ